MSSFPPSGSAGLQGNSTPAVRTAGFGEGLAWVSDAFRIFAANLPMWIVVTILFYFVNLALAMVPFAGQLLTPMLTAGWMLGCRDVDNGGSLRLDHFMQGFTEKPVPLLLIGVFYLVATLVIVVVVMILMFVTVGGTVLMLPELASESETYLGALLASALIMLVVMALTLPVVMAYWFAVPLVQFHDVPPMDALKLSFSACLKNIWPFLLYGIVMLVLCALVFVPFGLPIPYVLSGAIAILVILFVGIPVTIITMYTSYKGVFGK